MNIRTASIDVLGYVFTNRFHIALMPIFITYFWNQALQLPLPVEYYVMIALTTAAGYIYNMQTDAAEDAVNYSRKHQIFIPDTKLTKWTIFTLFFLAFLISLTAGWRFALYGGVINYLFSLYSRPLPFERNGRAVRIKEIPFLKNIYCASCWSIALVLTPYVFTQQPVSELAYVAIAVSFLLNYWVELLWDLRDREGDLAAGFKTVPTLIGENATIWLMRAAHVLTCAIMLWAVFTNRLPNGFLVAFLHLPAGLLFLEWYRRLDDQEMASHTYIMYAGLLATIGVVWNALLGY